MQAEIIQVTGMTCGGCTSNVTQALKTVNGVNDVTVSLSDGKATVQYDEKLTSPEQLKSAVIGAGYGVDTSNTAQQSQGKGCCG
ncbi:heavy-metal-associated domain-containing protein [Methylotenera versatilis]|uniref:heavy-metal-associated domain-containing protein n=1 Tax=Methylotenera versatilis TaxID=1055487 RepID=UPI0006458C6D|nr:heavy-metal-associated domain-containing protein [Methylotenera versatilis]